ncbi:hypothetical protein GGG16DRAFT_55154, partial [Schizophyllum commune]
LKSLPGADYIQAGSTKACLPGTRVQLLEEVADWVFAPGGTRLLILHGTAGKGKSAVAHTIALRLSSMGVAVPFFAFNRADLARRAHQLYPTLAEQLARSDHHYLEKLRTLSSSDLRTLDILDQYERLISSLLRDHGALVPIVFVIDALDECPHYGGSEISTRAVLLNTLKSWISDTALHYNIRLLITTRPDEDICRTFDSRIKSTTWKSIDNAVGTEDDIHQFVEKRLGEHDASNLIDLVTTAAQSHFECAAVLCRELTDASNPKTAAEREEFIKDVRESPGKPLYKTYRAVLSQRLSRNWIPIYRQALAWVLAVRNPQPLVVFLDFAESWTESSRRKDLASILASLGSLISGASLGDDTPLRPLHTSFRDFVLDSEESNEFCVSRELAAADSQLALVCFRIMSKRGNGLRYNLIKLSSPFVYKEEIKDLDGRLIEHISPGLRYACREISAHLSRCANRNEGA